MLPKLPTLALLLSLTTPAMATGQATTSAVSTSPNQALTTLSERSGFVKTGRYDEVIALCDAFQARYPDKVRCFDFGTTPEGRPMKALVVSGSGLLQPEAARASGLPVLLVQGGIHAGEIDGKDAGFQLLRQLLDPEAAAGETSLDRTLLDKTVLVFVPVFNVDGHERFGAWNRPNQRGPEQMGWRTTAQNYNLNRDYMKANAPEMQAMLQLVNAWDPIVMTDLHVTDGAKFEHDVSITGEPVNSGDLQLRKTGRAVRDGIIGKLAQQGSLPLAFYPSFVENDNPASGFEDGVSPPRFSHGYFPLRNRVGILVETHSWKDYPTRVRITRNTVLDLLQLAARDGKQWLKTAHAADRRAKEIGGTSVPLQYATSEQARIIDFRGYAYTRTPSDVSGGLMTRYDETTPQIWKIPLRDRISPSLSVKAPRGGYLVPAAWAGIVEPKLKVHGIAYRRIEQPLTRAKVQAWRASKAGFAAMSVEGNQRLDADGAWQDEAHDLGGGALFVPIAQANSRMVMGLLEPQAPDSLAAWGVFNNAFEQKEYMEEYVAEDVAREMLAKSPEVKAAFEKKLKDDPEFAKSPEARLDFFYRLHSAYDTRLNLYPVLRTDAVVN